MGDVPEIKDFPKVLQPHLGDGQLVSYKSRYLTKPGENYGSLMLAVTANVKKLNGDIEELPLVVKLPPNNSELHWKIFQPAVSCLKEIVTYKSLAKEIRQLQLDCGIKEGEFFDCFPEYFGSRMSLDPKKEVDRDALLVLENLQTAGFKVGNRLVKYDLAHTRLILRELANFHALTIGLRLKKPEIFDKDVRPYFRRFNLKKHFTPQEIEDLDSEGFYEIELATNNNGNLMERAKELADLQNKHFNSPDPEDGPYTVISHNDLWINNILIKYDESGAPKTAKFVDFQISDYDSVAHDIIFFFFSSVDLDILEANYDELLQYYYKCFIDCLERMGIDTKVYSYESFLKEIERYAPIQVWHAIFMQKVILADANNLPDNFKDVDLSVNFSNNKGIAAVTKKCAEIIRLAQKLKYY